MIKINLIAERRQSKAKTSSSSSSKVRFQGGSAQNLLLAGIVISGLVVAGGMWWSAKSEIDRLTQAHRDADAELARLEPILEQTELLTAQKDLVARKIDLITNLKKSQSVPVRVLDEISRNLPDFLWLESMASQSGALTIVGKGTTYNAVSGFYKNLSHSGRFSEVTLGRTFEIADGVSFSLTCKYVSPGETVVSEEQQQPVQG